MVAQTAEEGYRQVGGSIAGQGAARTCLSRFPVGCINPSEASDCGGRAGIRGAFLTNDENKNDVF
jgi:hypothetical protein